MILTEKQGEYIKTYSDNYYIQQGNHMCIAAFEVKPTKWTETDILREKTSDEKDVIIAELRAELETYKRSEK